MPADSNDVAVIGLGTFGCAVARDLASMGERVVGIDCDRQLVASFSEQLHSVVEADATDIKALEQMAIDRFGAVVVSIGENLEASVVVAMNALQLGCSNVWVKAQSDTHSRILEGIGITNIVRPEQAHGAYIAQLIHNPNLSDYLSLSNGQYVAHVEIPERAVGKLLGELAMAKKYSVHCLGVIRDGDLIPGDRGDLRLAENDSMILFGKAKKLRRFADS